jgi:radical SAM superfamily enzyme YgiQ (UPF0313 family)
MNALLIWPQIPLTYWGGQYSVKLIGRRAFMPPLGLLTVAALCPKDWQFRLIDLNAGHEITDDDLAWADIAMLSGMAIQHQSITSALLRCKTAGVPTIVGGPDATSSPEKFDDATYLILDEAEVTLPKFLSDFAAGKQQRVYSAGGEKPNVTSTPAPRFDLLKLGDYTHMCVQFSRGCPFACEFCDITTLYGRTPRTKHPKQIVAEMQVIYDLGFRGEVFLVDDNFIGNKRDVKLMLPELIGWMQEHKYPFWLYTEASLNLADDSELLELMAQAGFHSVFVGIESPSIEALRETQKYQNIHGDMLGKVHKIQEYGMEVMAGFILGFDHDPPDIFERQIEFITKARIPMAMVGALNAMPSTQLWNRLKAEGRLQTDFRGDNLDLPNFETKMDSLTLIRGYRTVLATLYTPANYFARLSSLISSLKVNRNESLGRLNLVTKIRYLAPLLSALCWLGIHDSNRKEYWRFFLWVLQNHRDKWLFALCRTITGYHFIRYTAEVMVPKLTVLEKELEEKEPEEKEPEEKEPEEKEHMVRTHPVLTLAPISKAV